MRLLLWADQHGGWKVFGSSSGFHLPDGSVLSPDASLVALDRWQALSAPASRDPQRFEGIAVLEAVPEFPGLQLQLAEIWAG